ncbi:MAG: trypsin-like peptidase domain-containing protein [Lachnospiraceae bacterium]|nr:trypsin-like peptidase domain-containing protein [Lachnospiraceae bacterium]
MRKGLWLLTIISVTWMTTACGGRGAGNELPSGGGEPGNTAESVSAAESAHATEPGNVVESVHAAEPDQDMQRYLRQVTVRFQGPQCLGSGVVWSVEEEMLVIATAAHVAEDNSPLTVQFEQGDPLETRLRYVSDQVDVAFVEVSLQELEDQDISWQVARQDREVCDQLEAGQPLWIMGSVEEAADRTYDGSVTQPWIYLEDFGNYMLLGHAYAIPGVSGGGVFTREGILVGILCGGNDADQIAVLPWSVMEANSQ